VLETQAEDSSPLTLVFPNTLLEIRRKQDDICICYVPYLNREMEVPQNRIYHYGGKTYRWDFTTYHLSVKAGEIVSFCGEMDGELLIKRDGIVGKYHGKYRLL